MADGKFVQYLRVSTARQGASGLGLDAQKAAVAGYLNGGNWKVVKSFQEVESGKHADRPELAKALDYCRKHKATLVIAKLDRLSRNVAFIASLMDSGVEFVACDFPTANRLTLHVLAAFAEHEREQISLRTKAALAAAKRRGKALGWANPARKQEQRKATKAGAASNRAAANRFASNVLPIIREIQGAGVTTLSGIADALNARGIATARGREWYAGTVKLILKRSAA